MANNEKRSSLRGLESAIFDLVCTGAATEQWAEWLKVPLQHAAALGDLRLVIKLQRAGANGNALHFALQGDQAALARDLMKRGASVTGKDENGDSPLHLAAALGDEETVSLLLEKGAPPNALDSADRTSLHVAAEEGHLAAVKFMLAAGADTSLRIRKADFSALDLAAAKGHVEIVTALIRSGADVKAIDSTGSTALHKAACSNEVGVINVLVEGGANVDAAEYTCGRVPLHYASSRCRFEAIVALLKNGARVEELDHEDRSPLHWATIRGHLPATKAILAAGADVNAIDDTWNTALHLAASGGHHDVSRVLVQAGADVNATERRGCTALHLAGSEGHQDVSRVLVQADAEVNAADNAGSTALHLAASDGHQDVLQLLVQAGADVNVADDTGCTALHDAASGSSDAGTTVRALIEAGATVDEPDEDGWTPLHRCASRPNSLRAMAVLLECGANPNVQDPNGGWPLHLVTSVLVRKDAENAVDLLLRWGADETAVSRFGQTPLEVAEERFGVDDFGRLRDLLTQAPVDRNWRRRGWLLLYRAYPCRIRPIPGIGAAPSDRSKKCRAVAVSTEAAGGASTVRGGADGGVAGRGADVSGDWSGAVTWVVGTELEHVFRNVVEYL